MGGCKGFVERYKWVVAKGLYSVTSGWLQRVCRALQVGGCKGFGVLQVGGCKGFVECYKWVVAKCL